MPKTSTENYNQWAERNREHVKEYKAEHNRKNRDLITQYNREMTVLKSVRLNIENDSDILQYIEGKNFSGYVKDLIRKEMTAK